MPPPPEAALSMTGKPIFVAAAIASSVVSQRAPGTMGTPAAAILSRAAVLLPIGAHRARGRADEDDARPLARLGQRGVLAEEAVAGVDGVAAGLLRDVDDLVDAQVALGGGRGADGVRLVGDAHVEGGAVGVGVDGDGARCPSRAGCAMTRTAISPRLATRTLRKARGMGRLYVTKEPGRAMVLQRAPCAEPFRCFLP